MDAISGLLGGLSPAEEQELIIKLCRFQMTLFVVFFIILRVIGIRAPYGRYARKDVPQTTPLGGSSLFGFSINMKLGWIVQATPSLVVPLACAVLVKPIHSQIQGRLNANQILLGCFVLHYIQRTVFYPFLIRGTSPTTLGNVSLAIMACVVNGYVQGRYLTRFGNYPNDWITSWNFVLGIIIFFVGFAINLHSDHILRNLRKPGETGYKIPRGGLFEYVSGANFFGEVVEWIGFGLAGWSLPSLVLPIMSALNLIPRALHHHQNYHEKFDDYPKNRKAVIPFLL
ncbi:3-oxo-5-alpha-steroid 4-dehydrogenase 1-like [Oscarella lobularis]|uniref:3-oxo-5-alpha-steroid 4-dehydrogenase 1-like n=1 Tax=Oscarella lobularis TaxID=121494 RepID=UPI003313DBF9